ncbi:MAG: hypothetical protein ACMUHX_12240 [bacterium]
MTFYFEVVVYKNNSWASVGIVSVSAARKNFQEYNQRSLAYQKKLNRIALS